VKEIIIDTLMATSGVRFGTSGARGRVVDITDEVAYAYTRAFLQASGLTQGRIALAIDLRPSSPRIAAACAAAIVHAGLEVDYCGTIPTPALAFHAQQNALPAIMVTGSHIPFDRNGIKFYAATGEITKADEARISAARVTLPDGELSVVLPAVNRAAYDAYIERYVGFFAPRALAGMRLGFFEHSSVGRDLLRELLERLGAEVISLGRTEEFVPIDTEAVSAADVEQAKRWAREHAFDAILSTDGDADRPLLGDENGEYLRGDIAGVLCARYLRAQAVVSTVSCNTALEACGAFADVVRTRIGSPYVIEGIEGLIAAGKSPVVGFEPNGGFLVGTPIEIDGRRLAPLMTRDAVLPIVGLLCYARQFGGKVSALPASLPARYTASDRLQSFATEKSRALIARLAASNAAIDALLVDTGAKAASTDETDGLRITLDNGEIVHFRPSGNAPELRCYAEATSPGRAAQLVALGLARMQQSAS
jgi:phosphomannomutase